MKEMKNIALDVPQDRHYGRQVCRGVHRYARPHRPWLFINLQSRDEDKTKWLRHADTIGLISMQHPQTYTATARRYGLSAVGVGVWAPGGEFAGLPYVDVDPKATGEMAAEYFIGRGFRNFAMITSDKSFHPAHRGEAFVEALRRRKLACDVFDHKKKYPNCDEPLPAVVNTGDRARACRWLASLPKPLAVFCTDDAMGLMVCGACRRIDIHVPEEVAVLACDNDDLLCGMAYPHLSSIAVPAEQIGFEAAKLLDKLLHKSKAPKHPILLPPVGVVTRQSTDVMACDDLYVVEALRFIRENAHRGIRVENVMSEVHLSRRPLERRFKKAIGRNPFEEIRRIQVEKARMLLAQTDMTLETIAPECGFGGVTLMIPAFRKATGMTPGAYRRQFRTRR